jgi:hypothetical protein
MKAGYRKTAGRSEVMVRVQRERRMSARTLGAALLALGIVSSMSLSRDELRSEDTVSNQIYVISPYRQASTWVFDDPTVGLKAEPFVSGIPDMIDALVQSIPHADQGFRLLFSAAPFPGYQAELVQVRPEYGGMWYRWTATNMEGWLCPALFKYFSDPPATLYARAEPF